MEYLDDYYPEVLDRGQARFYGQDPRYDGYLMARINIRLHMLGRLIRRQAARPASGGANADLSAPDLQVAVPSSEGLVPSREPASPLPRKEPPDGLGPLFSVIISADSQKKNPPGQLALPGFSVEKTPSLIASERFLHLRVIDPRTFTKPLCSQGDPHLDLAGVASLARNDQGDILYAISTRPLSSWLSRNRIR